MKAVTAMTNKNTRLTKEEMLAHSPIYQDSIVCQSLYAEGTSYDQLYTQDCIEIDLIVSGSGIHQIANQSIPCTVGDIYVLHSDVPHGFFVIEPSDTLDIRRIIFDPSDWFSKEIADADSSRFCYGIFSDSAITAYAMLNTKIQDEVASLYNGIEAELSCSKSEWHDSIRSYLTLLLITIGRYVNRAIKNLPSFSPKEWKTVFAVLQEIHENFHIPGLTLELIARTTYSSASKISRTFKKLTGKTFTEYLKDIRLKKACELLRDTELNVEDIVRACGLRDIPSFYHSFHSYVEMTPNQYRNTYNNTNKEKKIMIILSEISENLQRGKAKLVKEMVEQALAEGCNPEKILNEGLLAGMNVVGEKFKNNEVYVPEVLVAARAMNMGVTVLKPHLAASGVKATGKVCIGTVQGDLHDIGKNLVKMMMEGKGLDVIDLGTDVAPETFVQTAIEQNCQVICCSALLTTTMSAMADVVKSAEAAGIRDKVKIMIGGAPVNQAFCDSIGADCYTVDAASAADAAVEFCK
jgi:corrinoid protein of di/trimethylamine methyltransferase